MTATWMPADAWIRHQERHLEAQLPAILGFRTTTARPAMTLAKTANHLPAVNAPDLLERIDTAGRELLRQPRRCHSGRGAILRANRDLAVEVHALCLAETVYGVAKMLGISRQGLTEVWLAHDLTPPRKVPRKRGSRAGGMRS